METKVASFEDFEAKADGNTGIVEGYASVFGDRDHGRDRVLPGAFTKTLAARGNRVIYLPSHDYKIHVKDIPAVPLAVSEDSKGLHTKTQFFLKTEAGRDSFEVIKQYQEAQKPLGLSYTFKPVDYALTGQGRDLKAVDLYEYGHTALPMLDSARTIGVKAMASNNMVHSEETDHAHSHGDMIHSHSHNHAAAKRDGYDAYMSGRHDYHDHTAEQMKSLLPDFEWEARAHTVEDPEITDEAGLKAAIEGADESKDVYGTRRKIKIRAKELGLEALIPETWSEKSVLMFKGFNAEEVGPLLSEFEAQLGREVTHEGKTAISAALAAMQSALTQEEARTASSEAKDDEEAKLAEERRQIEEALSLVTL